MRLRHSKADDTELAKFEYALNALGIPTSLVEANGDRVTWTYDSLYRLTREQRSGVNAYDVTYTFDGAGNRMTKVAGGVTTTYTYRAADALLVEDAGGARTTYSYDNAGNTTVAESAAGRTTYSWDGENRLSGIALPDGTVWTLSCDATGLRREKQTPAGTTRFIWDGQRLLQETDSGGTTQAHYTAGLGTYGPMLSQRRSGASAFLHTDRLGTVRLLSDASAAAIDTYLLDAFGSLIASTGSTTNPLQYVGALGYYREPALGLDYVRARWLRPTTGSWLSVDPVAGEPRYGYVRGGPTWVVDGGGMQGASGYGAPPGLERMVRAMDMLQGHWPMPDPPVPSAGPRGGSVHTAGPPWWDLISPRLKLIDFMIPLGGVGVGGSCVVAWRYDRDSGRWERAWVCSAQAGLGGGVATGAGVAFPVQDLHQLGGWGWGLGVYGAGGFGGNLSWPPTPLVLEGQIGAGGEYSVSHTWVYVLPEIRPPRSYGVTPEVLDQFPPPGYDPSKVEWHS